MTVLMCGHCYRPATGSIYYFPLWRRLLGRRPRARQVCTPCADRYRNGTLP